MIYLFSKVDNIARFISISFNSFASILFFVLELSDYLWLIKQVREPFRFFAPFDFLGLESVILLLGNFHDLRNEA